MSDGRAMCSSCLRVGEDIAPGETICRPCRAAAANRAAAGVRYERLTPEQAAAVANLSTPRL